MHGSVLRGREDSTSVHGGKGVVQFQYAFSHVSEIVQSFGGGFRKSLRGLPPPLTTLCIGMMLVYQSE